MNVFNLKLSNIIGYLAAICTTIAFIPQVIEIINLKKTDGISLYMYIIFVIGIILWLIYGILIKSNEIIFSNIITLPLTIYILCHIIKNKS
tara:strand:- start:575 stop:847 length:273 start_codon:yes stop_codon:yes gene_type:complete